MRATILVPTHDHGPTLRHALRSIPGQTVQDIEVFIVGDGVPEAHRPLLRGLAASDPKCVVRPSEARAPRRAVPPRRPAGGARRDRLLCVRPRPLLSRPRRAHARDAAEADFVSTFALHVIPGGLSLFAMDLALEPFRRLMLRGMNHIPLSCGAHTLAAYRRLPHGWRTTPPELATDLYMWQQFLEQPWCRARSGQPAHAAVLSDSPAAAGAQRFAAPVSASVGRAC